MTSQEKNSLSAAVTGNDPRKLSLLACQCECVTGRGNLTQNAQSDSGHASALCLQKSWISNKITALVAWNCLSLKIMQTTIARCILWFLAAYTFLIGSKDKTLFTLSESVGQFPMKVSCSHQEQPLDSQILLDSCFQTRFVFPDSLVSLDRCTGLKSLFHASMSCAIIRSRVPF